MDSKKQKTPEENEQFNQDQQSDFSDPEMEDQSRGQKGGRVGYTEIVVEEDREIPLQDESDIDNKT